MASARSRGRRFPASRSGRSRSSSAPRTAPLCPAEHAAPERGVSRHASSRSQGRVTTLAPVTPLKVLPVT